MSVVSLSFEHHASDSTILLGSTPVLREHPGSRQGLPTSLPLPSTSREDPTAPQLVSLTTIPNGRSVSQDSTSPLFSAASVGFTLRFCLWKRSYLFRCYT
ncbi:hypothetical protein TNCV_1679091 [Trichonephila clavipes]|nr:hypothetical protein TNCV_1679091 [Trichonephila clavipes]